MKDLRKLPPVRFAAGLAAAVALALTATIAAAAEPVFPPGSRVGLVPPSGMVASDSFVGFADPNKNAAILITILPARAYSQLEKTFDADALKKQGISVQKREPMVLALGKAFLVTARQVADSKRYRKWLLVAAGDNLTALVSVQVPEQDGTYPDHAIRAALATLSVRQSVPEEEELGLLPFAIGNLAGFHIDNVLRGRAVILSDMPATSAGAESDLAKAAQAAAVRAHLLVAAVPGGPDEADERANFARLAFNEIGGIRDVHVTMSEPLRFDGQPGYQTMAEAKDARTGADIMVVQWLRFGNGGFLQMVGIAPSESWTSVLSRLRAVRDSVEPK